MMYLKISAGCMCNLLAVFTIFLTTGCNRNTVTAWQPDFDPVPEKRLLQPVIEEVSGIADGKSMTGILWAIEDSGNPPQLNAIGHDGQVKKKIHLKGITNRDWEDITLSHGKLLVAETGDNSLQYPEYTIYSMNEPSSLIDTITEIERIRFVYPDGSRDCEALLVDQTSGDIFLFTKSSSGCRIYRLAYPYNTASVQTVSFVGQINYNSVVSISQSADEKEIILKNYTTLFHFTRESGETIFQALSKTPRSVPYELEPQGEAISFAQNNSGYFTLSELGFASMVNLYFYKRK